MPCGAIKMGNLPLLETIKKSTSMQIVNNFKCLCVILVKFSK
jgi:hypothetical protein